jgi:transposase
MLKISTDGRGVPREVQEAYRMQAIKLRYEMKYSVKEISDIIGMHYNSVSRWLMKHRRKGENALRRTTAPGAERVLESGHLHWLEKVLTHDATDYGFPTPLWTGTFIRILLKREKDVSLDRVTVWRYLIRLGLSFQKPEKRYTQQDKKLVREWIRNTWPTIKRWATRNKAILYFEDESGVSLAPVVGKTWAPKGKTPIVRVTGKRGGVLAMSAVSPSGRLCFRLEKRKVNAVVLIDFLKQVIYCHPRRKIGVIMDQAPCHTSKKVEAFSKTSDKLKLFFLPPYSPDLNPDEKVWRHMKHVSLKNHQAKDKKELSRLVLGALRSIQKTPSLTKAFFANYLT